MKRVLAFTLLLNIACSVFAQNTAAPASSDFETRRKQASTLYQLGHATEALPLFEQLAREKPDDYQLQEAYGMTLLMTSATLNDVEQQKKMRLQAKQMLLKARDLGDKSSLMLLINDIPEDGSVAAYSERADVDAVMRQGEAAYVKGDYDTAITFYQKALAMDPKNYHAALFIGDSDFDSARYDEAGQWFAQAVAIEPNAETAYRYWGDALIKQQKWEQAKAKFIEAIVAEPYNQHSWAGLIGWANQRNKKLVRPNIVPPSKVEDNDKGATITIDANSLGKGKNDVDPAGAAWMMYPMTHVLWTKKGEFQKHYTNEKTYRHSLAEELDAFTTVLKVYDEATAKKKPKSTDPQIGKLQELRDRGFLESYILIHRADQGIAHDYPTYREAHRENIRDYLEYCIVANNE